MNARDWMLERGGFAKFEKGAPSHRRRNGSVGPLGLPAQKLRGRYIGPGRAGYGLGSRVGPKPIRTPTSLFGKTPLFLRLYSKQSSNNISLKGFIDTFSTTFKKMLYSGVHSVLSKMVHK